MKKQIIFFQLLLTIIIILININIGFSQSKIEVLIPLYSYPTTYNGTIDIPNWKPVMEAQKKVNITAIINPDSGPNSNSNLNSLGKFIDPDYGRYKEWIDSLSFFEVGIIGYVSTGYLNTKKYKPVSGLSEDKIVENIKKEIDIYFNQSHITDKENLPHRKDYQLNGIFFDEVSNGDSVLIRYRELYDYVKSKDSSWEVILNPGTVMIPDFLSANSPAGDIVVTYENSSNLSETLKPDSNKGESSQFAFMSYNLSSDFGNARANIFEALGYNYSNIFVTDDTYDPSLPDSEVNNQYNNLPTFWMEIIDFLAVFNANISSGNWSILPDDASEIACNGGKTYILDKEKRFGNHAILSWSEPNKRWIERDGAATNIAVDENGNPWVVNSAGVIYNTLTNGNWNQLSGQKATDIACGGGKTFILGKDNVNGGHSVYYRSNNSWQKKDGSGVRIAVDGNGNPWLVKDNGDVFRSNSTGNWIYVGGQKATDISCRNGKVFIIGKDSQTGGHSIYQWTGKDNWVKWIGAAKRVAVDEEGNVWVVNSNGNIFKR